jgi:hypothetical protein
MLPSCLFLRVALADCAWQLDALNRVTTLLFLTKEHREFSLRDIGRLHYPLISDTCLLALLFSGQFIHILGCTSSFCIASKAWAAFELCESKYWISAILRIQMVQLTYQRLKALKKPGESFTDVVENNTVEGPRALLCCTFDE